ncbi:MAG: metal-dependent hydrolase [Candidatus Acidiferrales bacterium]
MLQTRGNKITWLGHATFRITTPSGQVVLIDPWIQSNPKTPESLKKIDRVHTILITHGHSDHIGDAVELAKKFKPRVVGMVELCSWLESKGVQNTVGVNKGGTTQIGEIEVTVVNAHHSAGITDGDKIIYGGEPCGYMVRLPGGLTIYHAGDTCVFGDMKLIADLYAPQVAMLPIGDHYTMGPREAALAIRLLNVRHVIPMHYGTFPALTGTPEALRQLTSDVPSLEYHVMKPGETLGESHGELRGNDHATSAR